MALAENDNDKVLQFSQQPMVKTLAEHASQPLETTLTTNLATPVNKDSPKWSL